MKIIKLGHIENILFVCSKCHTHFTFSSDELLQEDENTYYLNCPLCGQKSTTTNEQLINFIKKRNKFQKEGLK